jgi:histone acetyltransferase (RNA polymerase elongator complex component)
MSATISYPLTLPGKATGPIRPVFIPGIGCPSQCIYCNQRLQTGTTTHSLSAIYSRLAANLALARQENQQPFELAFYGGTFTQIPSYWRMKFLELSSHYQQKGLISSVRCSTRPDSCCDSELEKLAKLGLQTVEIGAQTFCSRVLAACNRGYEPNVIFKAQKAVKNAGLKLGIQLLPGLPGHSPAIWLRDVRQTCNLWPDFVRIYPCLVLKDTQLHSLYSRGLFVPWTLDQTVRALARGVLRFWNSNIPVIRMGLHPEPSMLTALITGPWHAALGSLVRSRVVLAILQMLALHLPRGPKSLSCPASFQGDLWGYRGHNHTPLQDLGLAPERVVYGNFNRLELRSLSPA